MATVVANETYRGYRIQALDDRRDGWIVRVYPPGGEPLLATRSSHCPASFAGLLAEARAIVDSMLETGAAA